MIAVAPLIDSKYVKKAIAILYVLVPILVIFFMIVSSSRKNKKKLVDTMYENIMPTACSISMIPVAIIDFVYDQMVLKQDLLSMLLFTFILMSVIEYVFIDEKSLSPDNTARHKLKHWSNIAIFALLIIVNGIQILNVVSLYGEDYKEKRWMIQLICIFSRIASTLYKSYCLQGIGAII
ncbi:hypothetical protein HK407_01g02500 [Ordospora pajunii]|jgi:hypothetical protein|uniref:uncharacterized protein n=1 Tax=Ordospora pajunii TaxID=3039483 RepID=UPI00295272AD|nr:uncharacterized protein HK407_01g02500 [Ordospora pajunii]KAH9412355.1 hypothetical protein HK407_01g02500 [Ordospora pajunii]